MATYTLANLRDHILADLTVIDPAAATSDVDSELVLARIQQSLEGLYEDTLIPFAIENAAIPGAYMIPLARVIAPTLAMAYGCSAHMPALETHAKAGMKSLRRLKAKPYFGTPAPATYY
jgi:hypothetical protein